MMRLDLATDDFIGARSQQQDAAAARSIGADGGAILVLADGLGGHTGGAEASRIVVETFSAAADTGIFDKEAGRHPALRVTLEKANDRIANGVDPEHGQRSMASTAVAVILADGLVNWISIGDSHLYVWRRGRLAKLNEDQSQAALMVRSGQYKAGDPEVAAARSVLVSALTGRKIEMVDHPSQAFTVQQGDVVLLASDGLNTLSEDEIETAVTAAHEQGAGQVSTRLLDAVRERRADRQDNTAVVVARIIEVPARLHNQVTQIAAASQHVTKPTTDISSAEAKLEAAHAGDALPAESDVVTELATSSPEEASAATEARPAGPAAISTPAPPHEKDRAPVGAAAASVRSTAAKPSSGKAPLATPPARRGGLPPGFFGNLFIVLALAAIAAGTYLFWKPSAGLPGLRPAGSKPGPGTAEPPAQATVPAVAPPTSRTPPASPSPQPGPLPPVPFPQVPPVPQSQPSPALSAPANDIGRPLQPPSPPVPEPTRTPGASDTQKSTPATPAPPIAPGPQAPPLIEPPAPAEPRGSLPSSPQLPPVRSLLPQQLLPQPR